MTKHTWLTIIEREAVSAHDTREAAEAVVMFGERNHPDHECIAMPVALAVAAPVLLAALKRMIGEAETLATLADSRTLGGPVSAAVHSMRTEIGFSRAAIAKAEGGQS